MYVLLCIRNSQLGKTTEILHDLSCAKRFSFLLLCVHTSDFIQTGKKTHNWCN